MGFFDFLGKALNSVGRVADQVIPGNQQFLHPQDRPAPQKPAPQQQHYDLGNFLHQAFNPHIAVPKFQAPKIDINALNKALQQTSISKAANATANASNQFVKGLAQPVIRGGAALGQSQTNLAQGKPLTQGINKRQFIADVAETGLNFAPIGAGAKVLKTTGVLPKIIEGAKLGGSIGGAQGAVNSFRNPNTTAQDYVKNIATGAALGGAVGGAVPAAGAVGRAVAKDISLGAPALRNATGAVGKDVSKVNKFTKGVQTSPEVSTEVQKAVSGQHTVRNTADLAQTASTKVAKQGLTKATQGVHDALSVPSGKIDDATVATAIDVAKQNDANGLHDNATSIYDALSEHLVKAGQTIQAASLLSRRTPEGLQFAGQRALKKAGVELTNDIKNQMQTALKEVKATTEGTPERDLAVAKFQQLIAKHIPSSSTDKALSIWKAGLLSGVKTQGGNFLSNATFAGLKTVSNPLAVGFDRLIGAGTGQRTKTLTGKGILSGTGEGVKKGANTLTTGIDERNLAQDKYQHTEVNFKNPVLNTYVNGVFRAMSAADQPFYYSSLRNNLADIAKADGLTKGLKGAELKKHINEFITNPPKEAFQTATNAAEKAVLGQDSAASRAVTGAVRKLGVAGQAVAPFTKVPTNFLERTLDYTPIGAIKEAGSQIKKGKFDQRALSEALSEATTGSAVIYLGTQLANNNMLSGDYPNDPKEQARWKTEGIIPNAVKLGNTWYSLNYLGPIGLLLGAGKNMNDAVKTGDNALVQATAGLGKGLTQQSFLQGLSGAINALNEPGRYLENYAKSQAGSVVPAIVNDFGNATDQYQRQANNIAEAVQARIPRLRQGLAPKQDAFGNDLTQAGGSGLNTAINPLRPSQDRSTDLTKELDRLKGTGKDNFVFPTPDKSLTVGKDTVKLNPQQARDWNKQVGQLTQDTWTKIIKSPDYQSLPDDKKATALQNAAKDINAVEKVKFLNSNQQEDLARQAYDKLTKNQKAIYEKGYDPLAYAKGQQPKSATAPKVRVARVKRVRVGRSKVAKAPSLRLRTPKLASLPKLKTTKAKQVAFKLPKQASSKKIKIIA